MASELMRGMLAACGLLFFAVLPAAAAAENAAEENVIEEIVVTGTKREASAQDVPIALTAISEEQLAKQFRTDILAVGEMSPSVALGRVPSFRAVAGGIRGTGQNAILVTQDLSVAVLVDEFGLSHVQSQFVELFDIDRVEVYRGPQGTLFGKSTTGGAISLITKRPVMNEYSANLQLQYGRYAGGDGAEDANITKYQASVNVPLIEDKLALRIVGLVDKDEGPYSDAKATGDPSNGLVTGNPAFGGAPLPPELDAIATAGSGENLNAVDVFASKVKLLWTPSDNYEAYFMWTSSDDNSDTPQSINESTATQLATRLGFPGIQIAGHSDIYETGRGKTCFGEAYCIPRNGEIDVDLIQLHQTLRTGALTWKLLLGEFEQDEIQPNNFLGEAFPFINASRNTEREETQVELRLATEFDGPFNFVAGYAYSDAEVELTTYANNAFLSLINFQVPGVLFNADGSLALDVDFATDIATSGAAQDRETTAFYFDGTLELTDRLRVTAGIRYTDDEKDFFRRTQAGGPCTALTPIYDEVMVNGVCLDERSNYISRSGVEPAALDPHNIPLPDSAYGIAAGASEDWDEVTYRFVVNYDVSDASMVYGSFSTGFIPGGFTETCSSVETCRPFESETNENWEIGFKGQFLDNTLQLNAAVFFTEYEDIVRSQVVPFTNAFGATTQETININAGVSELFGVEGELTWLATPNLRIDFFFGYLDHEYDEFDLDTNNDGIIEDLSSFTVPFTPEWKYGLTASYEHEFLEGSLEWSSSISHQDELETSVFNSPSSQYSDRDLWDANVTYYSGDGRYRLTLWGKNLTDERYRIAGNSIGTLWVNTFYGMPRSFGAELSVNF